MNDRRADPDIAWLNAALFDGAGFRAGRSGNHVGLPVGATTRRIVPLDPSAAAASFAKVHDAMSPRRLLAGRGTQTLARLGVGKLLGRQALALDAEFGLRGDPDKSVLARLGDLVDRASNFAITLGPPRSNRKPVVQLLSADGVTLAYAKVACDDVTNDLVANEADQLQRLDGGSGVLAVPRLQSRFTWHDRHIAVIDAVEDTSHDPTALDDERVATVARTVATPRHSSTLAELDTTDVDPRVLARFGDRAVEVAPWHGDLSPWNTISESHRTWVLDWEFARSAMPVGADVWHHQVMVATHLDGDEPTRALRRAHAAAPVVIERMDSAGDADAAFALYLAELVRRAARLAAEPDPLAEAADRMLDDLLT